MFQRTVGSYRKGRAQYEALKEELQRVRGNVLLFATLPFFLLSGC